MMDFGGRGAAGSGETAAAFGSDLAARGSGGGLPLDSPLLRCWSAMGSAGYRPELLKRSISLMLTSPIRAWAPWLPPWRPAKPAPSARYAVPSVPSAPPSLQVRLDP